MTICLHFLDFSSHYEFVHARAENRWPKFQPSQMADNCLGDSKENHARAVTLPLILKNVPIFSVFLGKSKITGPVLQIGNWNKNINKLNEKLPAGDEKARVHSFTDRQTT